MPINIYTTPVDIEPLPVYRRDPETASVISSAPSYTSEAPTYHSRRESQPHPPPTNLRAQSSPRNNPNNSGADNTRETQDAIPRGLPAIQFAPGFHSRGQGNLSDPERHSFNVSQWSNTSTSHASRQLHAVARRRASQAVASSSTTSLLGTHNNASSVPTATPAATNSSSSSTSPTASSTTLNNASTSIADINTDPISPHEDPYLVGEAAAQRARHARIYREMCLRGDEALRQEGQTWDFMLSQMHDWDERGRSWTGFRDRVANSRYPVYGFGLGSGAVGAVNRTRKRGLGVRGRLWGL